MAFRPYAKFYVALPLAEFVARSSHKRSEEGGVRSQSPHLSFHNRESSAEARSKWESQLAKMKEKAHEQRKLIQIRDQQFQAAVEEAKKVTELRHIIKKRNKQSIALRYRLRVHAKIPKEVKSLNSTFNSTLKTDTPKSSVFLTIPEDFSNLKVDRRHRCSVTPNGVFTPRSPTPRFRRLVVRPTQ